MEQEQETNGAPAPMPAPEQETFKLVGTGEQVAKMFLALAQAQAEFGEIKKTEEVTVYPKQRADGFKPPPYKFKYAPLDKIIDATRPALAKHGLCIVQPPSGGDVVRTMLCHADGGRMETIMYIPAYRDIKEMGGFITYIRRYAQSSLLNVAGDEDADNNGTAVGTDAEAPPRREQRQPEPEPRQENGAPRELNQAEKAEIVKLVRELHGLEPGSDGITAAVNRELAGYRKLMNKPDAYTVNVSDYKALHATLFARAVKAKQDRAAEGPQ